MNKKIFLLMFGMIFLFGILGSVSATSSLLTNIHDYYNLNGTSAIDSLGHYDGTNHGGVTTGVSGIIENAFEYDGSSGYTDLTGSTGFAPTNAFTVNVWVKANSLSINGRIINKWDGTNGWILQSFTGSGWRFYAGIGGTQSVTAPTNFTTGQWVMLTITYDGSHMRIYTDGGNVQSTAISGSLSNAGGKDIYLGSATDSAPQYFNGIIDELGIWTKVLNQTEISYLYNSGSPGTLQQYPFNSLGPQINVSLQSPSNDSSITTKGTNFITNFNITSANPDNFTWKNASYYVWYANGTLLSTIPVSLSGNSTINTQFIDNFTLGDYKWNIQATYGNSTYSNSSWAPGGNFSFTYNPFKVNSENYTNQTIMGSYEPFEINISVIPGYQISYGYLVYNGTNYAGILSYQGNNIYIIKKNISIPYVPTSTNLPFYWNILMQNGVSYNTTEHNQTVSAFAIDDCSTYSTKLFNLNMTDEDTQKQLNGTSENTTINAQIQLYSYDRSLEFLNYSIGFKDKNPASICLSSPINSSQYRLDAVIQYSSKDRQTQYYNIQNLLLQNSTMPQNITLYDLLSSEAQPFLITYKDSSFVPVENALIEITREYVQDGQFKTVEIPKTDKNGQAVGNFVLNSQIYKINIFKMGKLLASFDNVAIVCSNPTYSQCTLNLNAYLSGTEFTNFSSLGNVSYSMNFDKTTRKVTVSFSTLDGSATAVNLSLSALTTEGQNQTLCSTELKSSAGTLTCTIPSSYGNSTFITELYANGELINTNSYSIPVNPENYFGGTGIVLVLILMLTIPFMFITDKIGFIVGIFIGLILAGALVLYTQGSLIGIGSSLLWLFFVGGAGIYKLSQRD